MTMFAILAKQSGAIEMARGWWSELRTNRRAVAGLLVIIVLLAGYGLFSLRDATDRMQVAYGRELGRLQRIVAVAQERDWPQRAETSAALRAALETRLWFAESDGIARADIQAWLSGVARDIHLPTLDLRIELATPKSLPPDMRQITATITTQPSEAAVIALLQRIEQAPHLAVVDRLNIKQQPSPFLEMVLICYARIGPKIAAQAGAGKTAAGGDPE